MMHLVAFLEAAQDGDSVLHTGLAHHHGLEAALQRCVLLDILAVLVESGGTYAAQFPAGQHGFQDIARIHGPLGSTCPYHRMHLVNEQQYLSVRLGNLIQHGFESFFELAPELGPGHQSAHVERIEGLVLQGFRHITCHNAAGQPLHNGGLAHARLADEHRVVLGAAGKDLDGAPDFLVPANDRVQLAMAGQLRQVASVFLQGLVALLGILAGDILLAVLLDGILDAALGELELPADGLHLLGTVRHQRQQQMLSGDIIIFHGLGQVLGPAQHPHHVHAHGEPVCAFDPWNLAEHLLQSGLQHGQVSLAILKDSRQQPLRLLGQSQEHMG